MLWCVFKYIEFSIMRFQVKYHYESYLSLNGCVIFRSEVDSEEWTGRILPSINKSLLLLLDGWFFNRTLPTL